ncbi:MAG TPA: vWA domain-containing protein [Pirellulales bacterium]|nr:vWA domain-containing protein [Pirellulales bacterium]
MLETLKWLIGLRPLPSGATEGDWHVEFQALPQGTTALAAIALAVAALVGVFWLYRLEGRQLSLSRRLAFVALRGLIFAGVAFMLLDAMLVIERHEQVPSHLLVLMDTSQSMSLTDPYADDTAVKKIAESLGWTEPDAAARLKRLRDAKRYDLAVAALDPSIPKLSDGRKLALFHFDGKAQPVDSWTGLAGLSPQGTQTAIGDAIKQALAAHRNQPLAGVLLVTDGQSNAGEDARKIAQAAGKQGVPIHVLAMGTEQGPSNARLTDLEASPVVFVRDPIKLAAVIDSQGERGQEATVRLEQRKDGGDWTEVSQTSIVLGEDGAVQRVEFDFTPDATGQYDFRATISDIPNELTEADNSATQSVKVVRQRIRVLLVAGYASPEVQFLRNALLRDPQLEFSSWLQNATENYEQVGQRPLRRLPATQAELNQYDTVIMFDPNVHDLGPNWSDMLTKFVGDAGGGFIYVSGELNTPNLFGGRSGESSSDSAETAWVRMLPVVSEPGLYQSSAEVKLSARETWNLELTADGADDPIFHFSPDPTKNKDILASLPGMYWYFPVTRAKPGATILAQHGDQRMRNSFGRHVLMAMQRYGPGRAVFIGFDSTYRWRYLNEEYFDGFWARMVDRVGRSKVLGGRYPFTLATDKSAYRVGDRITVHVSPAPGQEDSGALSQLHGDAEVSGQEPIALEFEPQPDHPNVLEATFKAEKAGAYLVRVLPATSAEGETTVRAATLPFRVDPPQQEFDNPRLNRPLLDDIAQASGGKVFTLDQADEIPAAFRIKQVDRVLQYRQELWDAPLLALTIVTLLTIEWVWRKTKRMA